MMEERGKGKIEGDRVVMGMKKQRRAGRKRKKKTEGGREKGREKRCARGRETERERERGRREFSHVYCFAFMDVKLMNDMEKRVELLGKKDRANDRRIETAACSLDVPSPRSDKAENRAGY